MSSSVRKNGISSRNRQTPEKSTRPWVPVPFVLQRCSKYPRLLGTGSLSQSYRMSSNDPHAVQATFTSDTAYVDPHAGLMHC
jgi:hypothetical protein